MENVKDSTRLAQSASALGAGILGFGLGAKWGGKLLEYAVVIIIIGAILHIAGMYVMQLKNKPGQFSTIEKIVWLSAWVCLIAIVILFIFFALR